jgi:maltokinase
VACGASSQDSLALAIAGLDCAWLAERRWFAGKGRSVREVDLVDRVVPPGAEGAAVALAAVSFEDGGVARYALPVRLDGAVARECTADDPLWLALGRLVAADPGSVPDGPGRALSDDQSHTSIVLGEAVVVKLYRRLAAGPFPEAEALAALNGLDCVPRFLGALAHGEGAESTPLVVLQEYVAALEAGWEPFIERVVGIAAGQSAKEPIADAARLGELAAEIHVRLAERLGVTTATPEALALRRAAAEASLDQALELLDGDPHTALAGARGRLRAELALFGRCAGTPLCRIHGDLHVGQVLRRAGGGLAVVDFEGEPGRPPQERAAPWTPLRDVASLLLSFDNAAAAAARRARMRDLPVIPLERWSDAARTAALAAWEDGVRGSALRPDPDALRASLAEKQVSELLYAARYLPEWLYAPLEVLERRFTGAA